MTANTNAVLNGLTPQNGNGNPYNGNNQLLSTTFSYDAAGNTIALGSIAIWASSGKASRWDPVSAVLDLTKGFKIGGYLDAQPMATGDPYQRAAYGNYAFGVWMRASGTPLPLALAGANEAAFAHRLSNPNQYRGRQMDSFFWSLPAANVANIVRGYNDQKNGTLCHKQF